MDGCILRGACVVIPPPGRSCALRQLHDTHPGVNKMKNLTRSYLWWPGLDAEKTDTVTQCHICQSERALPAKAPLHPWEWPSKPWDRLHIDHACHFHGKLFLIAV